MGTHRTENALGLAGWPTTKRKTKHRGNAAGMVESRGRTGRRPTAAERSGSAREKAKAKEQRLQQVRPPAHVAGRVLPRGGRRGADAAGRHRPDQELREAIALFPIVLALYVPISYYTDAWLYKRRMRQQGEARRRRRAVSGWTCGCSRSGPVQENAYIVSAGRESGRAVMVDPGEESERLLAAADALGVKIEAILITHCHFDHIGAVAPVARATGAPVYCPEIERAAAERHHDVGAPGVRAVRELGARAHRQRRRAPHLAGLEIEVVSTPGHSPGHVTYAIAPAV